MSSPPVIALLHPDRSFLQASCSTRKMTWCSESKHDALQEQGGGSPAGSHTRIQLAKPSGTRPLPRDENDNQ